MEELNLDPILENNDQELVFEENDEQVEENDEQAEEINEQVEENDVENDEQVQENFEAETEGQFEGETGNNEGEIQLEEAEKEGEGENENVEEKSEREEGGVEGENQTQGKVIGLFFPNIPKEYTPEDFKKILEEFNIKRHKTMGKNRGLLFFHDTEEREKVRNKMKELDIKCDDAKDQPPKKKVEPTKNPVKKDPPVKPTKKVKSPSKDESATSSPSKKAPKKSTAQKKPPKKNEEGNINKNDFYVPVLKDMKMLHQIYNSQMLRIKNLLTLKPKKKELPTHSHRFSVQFLEFFNSFENNDAHSMATTSRKLAEAFFYDLESISGYSMGDERMSLGKKIGFLRNLLKDGLFKENKEKNFLMWRSLCFLDQLRLLGNENMHFNTTNVKKKNL